MNATADAARDYLRVWIDAKATLKVAALARGPKSRLPRQACEHDFQPNPSVSPVAMFLRALDELYLYRLTSKLSSDCLVDCLVRWWAAVRWRFAQITSLVINLDNRPQKHSRRSHIRQRLVEFAQHNRLCVRLAVLSALS
jgi:Rhodopirellula transposase DDE domain